MEPPFFSVPEKAEKRFAENTGKMNAMKNGAAAVRLRGSVFMASVIGFASAFPLADPVAGADGCADCGAFRFLLGSKSRINRGQNDLQSL